MAVFPSFKLTEKGEELLNRSIGEGKTLTFTKFELGDGNTPSDFRKQTGLVNKFYEFPILNTSIQKDQVLRIRGYFDNKSFSQDKQLKEIGVFVKIEGNETQYLYSYTNAGDTGDIIPANSRGFYSRTLDVANYIGYATNITFNIEQLRDRYAFNTENEMKVASYLKAGDKVELWGNLVLGDKPTDEYIIQDSGEIELSNGLFAKKVSFKYIAQTIEEMQKLALKVGDIVEVLGYYQAGDGAGHKRVIASEDDGSGVQLENGLWANIVHNGEVNVSWFGAKGDGVTDDGDIFKKSINYSNVVLDKDIYLINSVNIDNDNFVVLGNNNYIYFKDNGLLNINNSEKILIQHTNFKTFGGQENVNVTPINIVNSNNIIIRNSYFSIQRKLVSETNATKTISLEKCNSVAFINTEFKNLYPDGLYLTNCSNLDFNNCSFLGVLGNWTLLNIFYSENVSVKNSYFNREDSGNKEGSTINFNCKNSSITNCCFKGGKGIDISNETSVQYVSENITISNNRVVSNDIGIYSNPSFVKNINITNNMISFNSVGCFLSGSNVRISENNFLSLSPSDNNPNPSIQLYDGGELNYFSISNNDSYLSNIFLRTDGKSDKIIINNNFVELYGTQNNSDVTYKCGNFLVNKTDTINNLNINSNIVRNISGAFMQEYITQLSNSSYIEVKNNTFEGNIDVDILNKRTSAIREKVNIILSGNIFKDVKGINFTKGNLTKNIINYNTFISTTSMIEDVINTYDTNVNNTILGLNTYDNTKPNILFSSDTDIPRNEIFELNTPYRINLMEQEGGTTKKDFYTYLGEKFAYDKQVKEEQKAKYEAYELLLQENPNLTWEEFEQTYGNTSMMNRRKKRSLVEKIEEPQIPESVVKFMEKYL